MYEPILFSFAIALNLIGAILLAAVMAIILWLGWRERVNQCLALYLSICLAWSLSALVGRIVMTSKVYSANDQALFGLVFIILYAIAGNSPFLLMFVVQYLDLWRHQKLRITVWIAFLINLIIGTIFWFAPDLLIQEYGITQVGMITIEPQPITSPIIGLSYFLWYGYAIYLLWRHGWPRAKWICIGATGIAAGFALEVVSEVSDQLPIALVSAGLGSLAFAYAIVQDTIFSPLQRKNSELHQSRKNLELALSAIPGGVVITDPQGNILWANEETGHLLGIEFDNLADHNLIEFYVDDAERSEMWDRMRQFNRVENHELRYRGQSNQARWGRVDAVLTQYNGHAAHLGILQDIHEQYKAKETLQKMQKWESLAVLAGGIAHDFNNLLVGMLGQASIAQIKMGEAHPSHRHLSKVVNAAERASKLTHQMLAYSGRGQFEIRPIQLNSLISDNFHLFEASLTRHVTLKTDFHDILPCIEADTAQMQQVIMNLIINASQAIGNRPGVIKVRTGIQTITIDQTEGWHFTGEELTPGQYVTVEIEDNGSGMDDETLRCIFDPFFTTKSTGSGLGLAAVLGIVHGHKGGIQVFSEIGEGTKFRLLLPAMEGTASIPQPISAETDFSTATTQKVLVIDDEPSVTEVVQDILESEGVSAMIAHNGSEGIDLYRAEQSTISLVLLDLSMPGLNGEDVFKALRNINPNVHVILSSGYSQIEATRHFIGRGLAGFIQKPYDYNTLLRAVQPYLAD